jgi:molybdenum cofactor cytidylyltransferase
MSGIAGILLAAGASRRFGADKLLHPLASGEAVAVAAARNLVAAVERSIAVVRYGDCALVEALARTGLRVVVNPQADAGIGTSIAAGVAATPDARGWLIALADMPWIAPSTITAVAAALADGASLVAPSHDGRRGHPVGFAARWRADLLGLRGDSGGREILTAHAGDLVLRPTDDAGVLRDIDRIDELAVKATQSAGTRQDLADRG